MDSKKARERTIFDLVYGDRKNDHVQPSERPDFIVRSSCAEYCFGVEVSELYHSESAARFDRIPQYTAELLKGSRVRHKDDTEFVTEVDILSKNNVPKARGVRAVINEILSPIQCAEHIAARVTEKAAKLRNASSSLSHLNLIVRDHTSAFSSLPPENCHQVCFNETLRDALAASSFREVFLVTTLSRQLGYVPLKALYLLSEAFLFSAMLDEPDSETAIHVGNAALFASYLSTVVATPVLTRNDPAGIEVIYGDSGLLIGPDHVAVRIYSDLPLPTDASVASPEADSQLPSTFRRDLDVFRSLNAFSCPLWFPTQHTASQ